MKISGANVLPHPVGRVWEALLDPQVLVSTIPGCSRLETTGEHAYAMTVTAGVAAIKGTYDGSCSLADLVERESLTMRLQGAGAPGTVDATVAVRFDEVPEGTRITWDADAVVGGMVGGVGQRMLSSVSKRMAGEFFDNVGESLTRPKVTGGSTETPALAEAAGEVFTAPPPAPRASSQEDFVKGIAVGAGLVLLGVVAQGIFGRRRS
ncbi:carbon monoxide dehydrogenase subunit G [Nocardioides sp. 503]|uniref:SRPBCC family protein n=1 Tax=Nocardioides sp. 503 TaxID=2508326 RepID=UPI00106FE018|nr:carbon monoxide dehydrogenase subunit G [Nocardioides sp. 503]